MSNANFTADNTALLLIDHQVGTMQLIKNIDKDLAAKQSIALAKMANILNMPVVITSSQEERAQGPILRWIGSRQAIKPHRAGIGDTPISTTCSQNANAAQTARPAITLMAIMPGLAAAYCTPAARSRA
jgi:nicotinamidase-related amidase